MQNNVSDKKGFAILLAMSSIELSKKMRQPQRANQLKIDFRNWRKNQRKV